MKNNEIPHVKIVLAKCHRNKESFGMRFEEKEPNTWVGDWAFKIKESAAKRERYDNSKISGSIGFDYSFPGCPYCESKAFLVCSQCNNTSCRDEKQEMVTCPWCGARGKIDGTRVNTVKTSVDR